jgi:AraC-type DNA-binding domain-containing proteins
MKAAFESLHLVNGNSFHVRQFDERYFSAPYHYHPELELTLILQGDGKRYVGNSLASYQEGDLVLLGPNLPHCWKSEHIKKGRINARSLVIQFAIDFLGKEFFDKTEMAAIHGLFVRSQYGVQFTGRQPVNELLQLEKTTSPFKRMIMLLEILQQLAESKQYELIDRQPVEVHAEHKKINQVMAYIIDHFRENIVLEKAAAIAMMTPTAFCKYFKRHTRKTFMETVLDFRINYAAQQLVHTDKPVSDISYESGFGDVSHFYKVFKSKKALSPLQYRKKFASDLA